MLEGEWSRRTKMVEAAAERVNYRMTFGVTEHPRRAHRFGIDGPGLPDRDDPSKEGSGDWEDPDFLEEVSTEEEAIRRWFEVAIREAVHEVCEWFRVDGELFLDPHGEQENPIHEISGEFAHRLSALKG